MDISKFIDKREEKIVMASRQDMLCWEEKPDLGNVLFASARTEEDRRDAWIATHDKFFTATCWRWAECLAPAGHDIDDLRQEARTIVFLAWNKYNTNRSDARPTTFFWKCILNKMRELCRNSFAAKRVGDRQSYSLTQVEWCIEFSAEDTNDDDIVPASVGKNLSMKLASKDSVEEMVLQNDTNKAVMKAINSLKEEPRMCLLLHAKGYTQKEIGRLIGKSQASVSYYISEAKKSVKEILAETDGN